MTRGTGVIAWLDHGPSHQISSHHYFVLLNSDGKSREALRAHATAMAQEPGYRVLRHDGTAHAIEFEVEEGSSLYSYVVYEGGEDLGLPYLRSANKRLNVMLRKNAGGDLVVSVCDPHVDIESEKAAPNFDRSRDREIRLTFDPTLEIALLSSFSGLPQTNPPLGARLEGNTLVYLTRNAVSDTFVFREE